MAFEPAGGFREQSEFLQKICGQLRERRLSSGHAFSSGSSERGRLGLARSAANPVAVALEDMLKQSCTFRSVQIWCVRPRQALVEDVLNRETYLGAGLRLLAPVQDQRCANALQQVPGDLLTSSRSSGLRSGPGRVSKSNTVSSSSLSCSRYRGSKELTRGTAGWLSDGPDRNICIARSCRVHGKPYCRSSGIIPAPDAICQYRCGRVQVRSGRGEPQCCGRSAPTSRPLS